MTPLIIQRPAAKLDTAQLRNTWARRRTKLQRQCDPKSHLIRTRGRLVWRPPFFGGDHMNAYGIHRPPIDQSFNIRFRAERPRTMPPKMRTAAIGRCRGDQRTLIVLSSFTEFVC